MKNTPIERHLIDETINEFQIVDFSKATIREVKAIASKANSIGSRIYQNGNGCSGTSSFCSRRKN